MALRRTKLLCLLVIAVFIFSGCGQGRKKSIESYDKYGSLGPKKIGVVLGSRSKNDAGINDMVIAGVKRAATDIDAEYKLLAPGDLVNNEESLRFLAENDYDMVIAIGQEMEKDLGKVAPDYDEIKFVIINGEVEGSNIASIRHNEEEGAFLAGAAAASLTKTNIVGYVGGSMASNRQLEQGFAKGVQYINTNEGRKVKVSVSYAGVTEEAAKDPERGKTLANNLYWFGADVIFSAEGKLSEGLVKAAVDNKGIALTGDIQLMTAYPWNVYGVLVKKQDPVIYELSKDILAGKFKAGKIGYGLKEGAVNFSFGQAVTQEMKDKIAGIRDKLIKGSIRPEAVSVPDDLITKVDQMLIDANRPPVVQQVQPRVNPAPANSAAKPNNNNKPAQNDSGQVGSEPSGDSVGGQQSPDDSNQNGNPAGNSEGDNSQGGNPPGDPNTGNLPTGEN